MKHCNHNTDTSCLRGDECAQCLRDAATSMPRSVKLMLEKYNKNHWEKQPHKRKRLEVSCVIQATGIERLARELEDLARTLRESGAPGYVGSGGGYYTTMAYAVTKRGTTATQT